MPARRMITLARLLALCAVGLGLLLWSLPLLAAETSAATTVIQLGPLVEQAILAAAAVLSAGVTLLVAWLRRTLRLSEESQLGQILDRAARAGIQLALHKAIAAGRNIDSITVQRGVLADAAAYLAASTPEALARFGMTPQRLEEYLRGRLDLPLGESVLGQIERVYPAPPQAPAA
ncbi:MAG: hypothetical protein OHK0024_36790 [Thalassobaculales bacterium]